MFYWFLELNFGHLGKVGVRHLGRDRKNAFFLTLKDDVSAIALGRFSHRRSHRGRVCRIDRNVRAELERLSTARARSSQRNHLGVVGVGRH